MLGLEHRPRADHTVRLEPGASLVLFTDGLVERRNAALTDSLAWLVEALAGHAGRNAEELADHLLAQLGDEVEDDVVLLVLRAYPEDAPRPAEAGPEVLPGDLR